MAAPQKKGPQQSYVVIPGIGDREEWERAVTAYGLRNAIHGAIVLWLEATVEERHTAVERVGDVLSKGEQLKLRTQEERALEAYQKVYGAVHPQPGLPQPEPQPHAQPDRRSGRKR